jgi:hypothetical protein
MTVFVRNAAYLANFLLKASRFRDRHKGFDFFYNMSLLGPIKKGVFRRLFSFQSPNQLLRGDISEVSSYLKQQLFKFWAELFC